MVQSQSDACAEQTCAYTSVQKLQNTYTIQYNTICDTIQYMTQHINVFIRQSLYSIKYVLYLLYIILYLI